MSDPIEQPKESSIRSDQSGDLQDLPEVEEGDSESVRELAEEGQSFEAEVIDAVENSPDPDVAEVTTREVPEDDVPPEYLATRSSSPPPGKHLADPVRMAEKLGIPSA